MFWFGQPSQALDLPADSLATPGQSEKRDSFQNIFQSSRAWMKISLRSGTSSFLKVSLTAGSELVVAMLEIFLYQKVRRVKLSNFDGHKTLES